MCEDDHHGVGRRALFVTGAAAALTLGGVSFASEAADAAEGPAGSGAPVTRTVRGTLPTGAPDFVYLPVEVPSGVREIRVAYTYERPTVPAGTAGNALDIGIFDQRGTELGGKGFRGWSAARARSSSSARTTRRPATSPARSARAPGTSRWARTRWRLRGSRTRSPSR